MERLIPFRINGNDVMEDILEKFKQYESEIPSKWREEAEYRRANKSWLRRSQKIAVKILSKMRESGISQTELALIMECSQQYVSKILKGQENLSLETISKIEDSLGLSLLVI